MSNSEFERNELLRKSVRKKKAPNPPLATTEDQSGTRPVIVKSSATAGTRLTAKIVTRQSSFKVPSTTQPINVRPPVVRVPSRDESPVERFQNRFLVRKPPMEIDAVVPQITSGGDVGQIIQSLIKKHEAGLTKSSPRTRDFVAEPKVVDTILKAGRDSVEEEDSSKVALKNIQRHLNQLEFEAHVKNAQPDPIQFTDASQIKNGVSDVIKTDESQTERAAFQRDTIERKSTQISQIPKQSKLHRSIARTQSDSKGNQETAAVRLVRTKPNNRIQLDASTQKKLEQIVGATAQPPASLKQILHDATPVSVAPVQVCCGPAPQNFLSHRTETHRQKFFRFRIFISPKNLIR